MQLQSTAEEKAKLAHELGHCVLGAFYNKYSTCDVRQKHEVKADRWAFQHLIPYEELMEAVHNGYLEPWELAEYFEVPEDFMRGAMLYYQMKYA